MIQSCEKENLLIENESQSAKKNVDQRTGEENNQSHTFNVTDSSENYTGPTILGDEIINPYSVSKIRQAYSNLYADETTNQIQATDKYLKLSPRSIDEVKELYGSELVIFDYPLHYEVIEEGHYYEELAENEMPTLYTVIPVGQALPNVDFEILDEYYFNDSNPLLIAESFSISGHEDLIEEYTGIQLAHFQAGNFNTSLPECGDECELVSFLDDSEHPAVLNFYCDCPNDSRPPLVFFNECGCPRFYNKRKPAGCINVEDTEFSRPGDPTTFLPVRRVKVVGRNFWNNIFTTYADDNGCWKVNEEFSGNIRVQIEFEHERAKFRGKRKGFTINPFVLFKTITDHFGSMSGPYYDDIEVNYHLWSEEGEWPHMYWGAATTNNALMNFTILRKQMESINHH